MVRVFTQMKAKGKLLSEELNQLAENSGGLLGKFQIQNAVMKLTGKTAEQVGKMLETGKVDAALGAKAILTAIEDNLSGGKLGGVMAKMAGEIPGLLSTIKDNLGAELIPSIDDNVGFSAVRDMMRSFAAASDRAKPFLKESFGRLFGAVFGGAAAFAGDKGRSAFEAMFATVGRGVQRVAQAIEFVGPIARGFAYGFLVGLQRVRDVLSPVSGALAKLLGLAPGGDLLVGFAVRFGEGLALLVSLGMAVGGVLLWAMGVVMSVTAAVVAAGVAVAGIFTDLMTSFDEAFAGLASIDLVQAGVNIMFGLAAGIDLGLSSVLDTVASAGQAVIARVEGVFGIASPSKVMERLGGYTAEGFAVGLGKGQGVVEASMDAMAPPALAASAPALTAASLTGGAPVSITVQVGDIYVTSPAGSTPRAVAEAVREQLTAQLAVELERLAASIGYAPSPA
jgi:tape measure domain-containing protein